jgi:NitT/TauT family transport system substrate-binding protein
MNTAVRVIAALSVLTMSHLTASAQTPVRLVLDYAIQGQQSPIVLAADGGYFERAGVNVQVDPGYGSSDAIAKVAGGAYDVAFADVSALVTFNSKQSSAKLINVFQVYDTAPIVMLSLKASNITKPTDLANKRIASPPGASSRVLFPVFAAVNKIDTSKLRWIDVSPQLREIMLKQGQADATTALITDVAGLMHIRISEDDISIMRFSDYGVNLYGHALLTKPEFAARHADVIRKLVKGIAEALKATIANQDVAIAALKKRDPLTDENLERRRLELVLANAIVTDHVRKAGFSAVDIGRMQNTIDLITMALNRPSMPATELYYPDYLPPRSELMLP